MSYNESLPIFSYQEVVDPDEGIKRGIEKYEAIHFLGGEGEDSRHLGPEGCEDLLLQWGDLSTIAAVKIGHNSIDDTAVEYLCQLLQKNDNLLYFSLYGNPLTKPGGIFFAGMLAVNKTLISLSLSDCNINDATFAVLTQELELGNRSLLQLDVSHNRIQDSGAKSLAKALKVNDILTTVSLESNSINVDGAHTLEKALQVNYTLCDMFVDRNNFGDEHIAKIRNLCDRNVTAIREALDYCNLNVKEGPMRKAKICFVGKNGSGKTSLIEALKGQGYTEFYQPTEGAAITQVLTRLRGEMWYRVSGLPDSDFSYQFLSRFVNVKLDENIEKLEKQKPSKDIGFAGLKRRGNRRGSIKKRRASVTGNRKMPSEQALAADGRNSANAGRASRMSRMSAGRRSSVAMSVLNAVLGEPGGGRTRRNSAVKDLVRTVAHPFNRKVNDLLDDKDFTFYGEKERLPGEAKGVYQDNTLGEHFDAVVTAKARRERDNISFNLLELSGDRIFYTIHHAFLTSKAVYVLLFDMEKLAAKSTDHHQARLAEIKYINYWLKVIKYNAPDARLMVVGTHAGAVKREEYGNIESDISKLVFPELHRAHAKRKEALKLNKAVEAANEFAKELEEERDMVNKKAQLIINEKDRRLFFPVEISTGKGVNNIRLALDGAAQKQPYYGQKIPVRWLRFLDELRLNSPSYFCTDERVKALAFQNLTDEKEMAEALALFHELGYINHVTEIPELKDSVITNTLSFNRIMFKLIFTEDLASFDLAQARENVGEDVDITIRSGIMSTAFLDWLWSSEEAMMQNLDDEDINKAKQFFLEYAQLNLILSEYKFGGEDRYIIPSMIPLDTTVVERTRKEFGDGMDLRAKIKFGGQLTLGVFERLLCLCLQFSTRQEHSLPPILAMGWAQLSFGVSYVFRLVREPDDIIVHVVEAKKKKKVYKLLESVDKMLERMKQILGKGFNWQLTVKDIEAEGEYIPMDIAKKRKLKGWFS